MTEIIEAAPGLARLASLASLTGLAAVALFAPVLAAGSAAAADRQIKVEWNNPDLKNFATSPTRGLAQSVLPADAARVSKLKLPVLGFDKPPQQLTRSLAVGANPAPERKLIMDEENPIWYQIIERYGDITLTIEADLRLQQELPPSAKVYGKTPGNESMSAVSVMDGSLEPGMEGAIAEYTVYRYPNVPYRVTIECMGNSVPYCQNPEAIARDSDFLKLISAREPK